MTPVCLPGPASPFALTNGAFSALVIPDRIAVCGLFCRRNRIRDVCYVRYTSSTRLVRTRSGVVWFRWICRKILAVADRDIRRRSIGAGRPGLLTLGRGGELRESGGSVRETTVQHAGVHVQRQRRGRMPGERLEGLHGNACCSEPGQAG